MRSGNSNASGLAPRIFTEFDSALVGFFLSHLDQAQEKAFFRRLKDMLVPDGRILIIDGNWNQERAAKLNKEGRQERSLNDGRVFDIYKKYLDEEDVREIVTRYSLNLSIDHSGKVFIAAS